MADAKLDELIKRARASWAKLGEDLDAIEAIGAGEVGPGKQAKTFLKAYALVWNRHHGIAVPIGPLVPGDIVKVGGFVIDWAKDTMLAKRLLKQVNAQELHDRAARYLASRDPYYTNAKHPLGLFEKSINKWGLTSAAGEDADFLHSAPVDCKHQPPCRSDVAHTTRSMKESRR